MNIVHIVFAISTIGFWITFVICGDHMDYYRSRERERIKRTLADVYGTGQQSSTLVRVRHDHDNLTIGGEMMNFESPFDPILKPCHALIYWFTDIAVNFTECATSNSLPPRVCTKCVDQYLALERAYYALKDNRDTKTSEGVPCHRVIFGSYEVSYIDNLYGALMDELWSESRCSDCLEFVISPQFYTLDNSLRFSKSEGTFLNNRTATFLSLYSRLYECIERTADTMDAAKKNATVICNECWEPYQDLNLFYEESIMIKLDFCVDIDSAINDTIRFWRNELHCLLPALPEKQTEAIFVVLISLAVFAMTILFYVGSFMQGSRRKRRLKKYQGYATYGTSATTINSDIIQDYIADHQGLLSTGDQDGERTPLLFAGGRRTALPAAIIRRIMMDSLVQNAILCAQRFLSDPNDPDLLVQLENKLDSLNAVSQDWASSTTSVTTQWADENLILIEWFSCCQNLLSLSEPLPVSLSQKIIGFLTNFAWYNIPVRRYFYVQLNLASTLSLCVLRYLDPQAYGYFSSQCLKLLQIVTYKPPITKDSTVALSSDMLIFLLRSICRGKGDEISSDHLRYALGVLNNICTYSTAIKEVVRKMEGIKDLYRALLGLLQDSNRDVVINALALVMVLDDALKDKLLNARNAPQTLQCAFNVLSKGDQFMARHYAIDLFIHFVEQTSARQALVSYKALDQSMENVCSLLVTLDSKREQFYKVYELLLRFCKVDSLRIVTCRALMKAGPLDDRLISPLVAVIECARSPIEQCSFLDLPCLAMKLLKHVVEEVVGSGHKLANYISSDVLLQVIEECLKTTIETGKPFIAAHKSKRIVHCLRLATIASREDAEFRNDLLEVITPALCGHLVEFQMISNPIVSFIGASPKSFACGQMQVDDAQRWQGIGAQILFCVVDFLRLQQQHSKNHKEQYMRLLKDARLLPFLAYGLTSCNRNVVQQAFQIACTMAQDEEFPHLWLGELISNNVKRLRSTGSPQMPKNGIASDKACNGVEDKSLSLSCIPNGSFIAMTKSFGDGAAVDDIIASMRTNLNVNDPKISQIMEVYERKIAIMEAKERQFQELLQTRTNALQQSDRLLSQYRCGRRDVEQETATLRSLLRETELKCEQAIAKFISAVDEHEKLCGKISHLEKVSEEKDRELETKHELELKLKNMTDLYDTCKRDIESEREMHDLVRKHYDKMKQNFDTTYSRLTETENELKQARKLCKDQEQAIKNLTDQNEELSQGISTKKDEINEMAKHLEKLQESLQTLEKEKKQQHHQLTESQRESLRKTGLINEQEKSIQKLKEEVDKYANLLDTMHKLSSKGIGKA